MVARSHTPRLTDTINAIENTRFALQGISLEAFEADWQKKWLVERGIEIISEASRRLTDDLKPRHPEIPWKKVAGFGHVLRHDYENVSAPIIWKLVQDDLPPLEKICRAALALEQARDTGG